MPNTTENPPGSRRRADGGAARTTRWLALAALALLACGGRRATAEDHAIEPEPSGEVSEVAAEIPETVAAPSREPAAVVAPAEPEVAPPASVPEPAAEAEPVVPRARRGERFLTHEDAPILAALATEPIESAERGGGGRSLGFRITLADGTRAYFKPDQTFNGMSWNAEVAAYHLDRELGLGRVAPVVSRTFEWSELAPAARGDGRMDEIRVDGDGRVTGALIWWVPERLVPVELPEGWEGWLRIEGRPPAVTPFQRPGKYRRAMARARADEDAPSRDADDTDDTDDTDDAGDAEAEPDRPERPAEMSDLIVFDYLAQNLDRWGTRNTNIRTVGEGGPLMYLDNAAAFTLRRPRIGLMDLRLHQVQRFRRSTIDAVRALDPDAFAERLAEDPNGPLLDERHLANLATRRAHLLEYVDGLVAEHGEEAVYAWD